MKMHQFKPGDFAHYNVGSDTYAVKVIEVSPSGKTVTVCSLQFKLNEITAHSHTERHRLEDVTITGENSDRMVFKSRSEKSHKDGSRVLHPGFQSYRDPSF